MFKRVKQIVKEILAFFGLYNISSGVKISGEEKAAIILEHKTPELKIFVETGTRHGDMIEMVGSHFEKTYSIELDPELYRKARERFDGRGDVTLIEGDSGEAISTVLAEIHEPALFWLDAHGNTVPVDGPNPAPIKKELEAIFAHPVTGHVILIDDARHFDTRGISIIRRLAEAHNQSFTAKDGIFRIYGK